MSSSSVSGGAGKGFLSDWLEERTARVGLLFLARSSSSFSGLVIEKLDLVVTSVGQGFNILFITYTFNSRIVYLFWFHHDHVTVVYDNC